jgi:hypothetical protein
MKYLSYILICFVPTSLFAQDFNGRNIIGQKYAAQEIAKARANYHKPFYDALIKDKETAISIAETIVFQFYGKENIIKERPYECYLIEGFWYISGTLPVDMMGGTFEIIINAKNGQVMKLFHGK